MTPAPVIGVTAGTQRGAELYLDAVVRSGGEPRVVLPTPEPSAQVTLDQLDGLLLSGGADLNPVWHGDVSGKSARRDDMELMLLKGALDRDMPVLGICRGMQALNAVMGGGRARHIPEHDSTDEDGEKKSSYHRIYIAPGSKLAAVVGAGGFVRVNSRHSRGVTEAQKSPRLLAAAYSIDDGMIEALESPDHDWVIGVQFRPELRREIPPQFDRLFQGLVERAGR